MRLMSTTASASTLLAMPIAFGKNRPRRTSPRSALLARRRCCTLTALAPSLTCPTSRLCPRDWTIGNGYGDAATPTRQPSMHPDSWKRSRSCSATRCVSSGAFPGSRRGPAFAETVTISACPRGFSPSGCAAPAATCWPRSAASSTVTTTPTPSAPIRQSSNTSTAPGV